MACTPPSQSRSPHTHTQCVPLICLRVELKGQISKNPSYGSEKRVPGAQTGPPLRGLEGVSLLLLATARPELESSPDSQQPRAQAECAERNYCLNKVSLSHTHTHTALFLSLFPCLLQASRSFPSPRRLFLVLSLSALMTLLHLCGSPDRQSPHPPTHPP